MPVYHGSNKIEDIGVHGVYLGQNINAIYKGSNKLYQYLPAQSTFQASNSFQTYVVPKGCTKLQIDCVASKGADSNNNTGGKGGRVQCILSVTEGQTLYIYVGNTGEYNTTAVYNASDIRTNNSGVLNTTSLNSRLIVAGGGGNAGGGNGQTGGAGGNGGNTTGADGGQCQSANGGKGGTQSAGGDGGTYRDYFGEVGSAGSLGIGGNGKTLNGVISGTGGAGYYGGGSGGVGAYTITGGGGGGGGSSYTDSSLCSDIVHTQGYQNGSGYITITPTK